MNAHRINATLIRCAFACGVLGLMASVLAPTPAQAQSRGGTLAAAAEILPPGVNGSGSQELKFGNVSYGQVVDVLPGPAGSGAAVSSAGWVFENLRKGHIVIVDLDLPAGLVHGSASIPVDWTNANHATVCVVSSSGGACQLSSSYDPGSQPTKLLVLPTSMTGTSFDLQLYVGGKITVPASLPPGTYTASVTANFSYLF